MILHTIVVHLIASLLASLLELRCASCAVSQPAETTRRPSTGPAWRMGTNRGGLFEKVPPVLSSGGSPKRDMLFDMSRYAPAKTVQSRTNRRSAQVCVFATMQRFCKDRLRHSILIYIVIVTYFRLSGSCCCGARWYLSCAKGAHKARPGLSKMSTCTQCIAFNSDRLFKIMFPLRKQLFHTLA